MARRFEDLRVWQEARQVVTRSYDLIEIDALRNAWTFKNQFVGAALSIMNNIAEGFERDSDKQFVQFLKIAKASAGEVRSMLYVMLDRRWIAHDAFDEHLERVVRLSGGIQSLTQYLQRTTFGETSEPHTIRETTDWVSSDLPGSFFELEQNPYHTS